jgi:hypothetical protein
MKFDFGDHFYYTAAADDAKLEQLLARCKRSRRNCLIVAITVGLLGMAAGMWWFNFLTTAPNLAEMVERAARFDKGVVLLVFGGVLGAMALLTHNMFLLDMHVKMLILVSHHRKPAPAQPDSSASDAARELKTAAA